jgi:hypothetical protein
LRRQHRGNFGQSGIVPWLEIDQREKAVAVGGFSRDRSVVGSSCSRTPRRLAPNDGEEYAHLQNSLRMHSRGSLDGLQCRYARCGSITDQPSNYEINACRQSDQSPLGRLARGVGIQRFRRLEFGSALAGAIIGGAIASSAYGYYGGYGDPYYGHGGPAYGGNYPGYTYYPAYYGPYYGSWQAIQEPGAYRFYRPGYWQGW